MDYCVQHIWTNWFWPIFSVSSASFRGVWGIWFDVYTAVLLILHHFYYNGTTVLMSTSSSCSSSSLPWRCPIAATSSPIGAHIPAWTNICPTMKSLYTRTMSGAVSLWCCSLPVSWFLVVLSFSLLHNLPSDHFPLEILSKFIIC